MIELAQQNVEQGFDQLLKYDRKIGEEILKREETVDTLNKEIADYITKAMSMEISNETSIALGAYYHRSRTSSGSATMRSRWNITDANTCKASSTRKKRARSSLCARCVMRCLPRCMT